MTTFRAPALDKNAPIVDPQTGRITPYFQRFWQNISFTADTGANQVSDVAALNADVATINGQLTVINSSLAGKAPLASPALTGTPTAPTQAQGNSTTRLATTAFVHTEAVARATFTGWAAATGTADRTTFATYTAPTASATYSQAEMQAVMDHMQILSRRIKALVDDLKS